MKEYLQSAEETLSSVGASREGLTAQEAQKRLAENGPNKLAEGAKKGWLRRFFEQLVDPMIIVLLIAAGVNLVTIIIDRMNGGHESFAEFFIILAVVLLNAILGVVQEGKAEL